MLPDVLTSDLAVVFCGTAVGDRSTKDKAYYYYAWPSNKFWRTLHAIGLTPRILKPEEYRLLPKFGVGLTDLVKTRSGVDAVLSAADFGVGDLEEKSIRFEPRVLGFNGKLAAKAFLGIRRVDYGSLKRQVGRTRLFVLPSSSGSASRYWDVKHWERLASECAVV